MSTNIPVREMDLAAKIWMDVAWKWSRTGSLCGAQLAIDTTLVSPLRRDGSGMFRAANHDGAVLMEARRWKERTCPELSGEGGRARLVILAAGVGGRWSARNSKVLDYAGQCQGPGFPFHFAEQGQSCPPSQVGCSACMLGGQSVHSFLTSPVVGWGGDAPSVHEVVRDDRFEWRRKVRALLLWVYF